MLKECRLLLKNKMKAKHSHNIFNLICNWVPAPLPSPTCNAFLCDLERHKDGLWKCDVLYNCCGRLDTCAYFSVTFPTVCEWGRRGSTAPLHRQVSWSTEMLVARPIPNQDLTRRSLDPKAQPLSTFLHKTLHLMNIFSISCAFAFFSKENV